MKYKENLKILSSNYEKSIFYKKYKKKMRIIRPLRRPYQHLIRHLKIPTATNKTKTTPFPLPRAPTQFKGNVRRGAALSSIHPQNPKKHPYPGPQQNDLKRSPRSGSLSNPTKKHHKQYNIVFVFKYMKLTQYYFCKKLGLFKPNFFSGLFPL